MRRFLLGLAILLTLPASAHAGVTPPVGASVCSTECFTALEGDTWQLLSHRTAYMIRRPDGGLQWGSGGCTLVGVGVGACTSVPGTLANWRVQRFHPYRKATPYLDAQLFRFYVIDTREVVLGEVSDELVAAPAMNTPDCNASGENETWFVYDSRGPAGIALRDTAPVDADACGLPRVSTLEPAPPAPVVAVAKVQSCTPIAVGKARAQVTSIGVACYPARAMLARYVRSGAEPAGFVCLKVRLGRSVVAKCATPGRAARTVVGRWRL